MIHFKNTAQKSASYLIFAQSQKAKTFKAKTQDASWQCNTEKMQGRARLVELICTLRRLLRKS